MTNESTNLPATTAQFEGDGGAPSQALGALTIGSGVSAIVPQTFDDVFRFSRLLAASGMTPYGMNTPEKCAVAILHGMELGLKPMAAIQSIAVIGGRPAIWGDVAMAMIRSSGQFEDYEEEYLGTPYEDDYTAVCTIKRKGQKPVRRTFSVAQAKRSTLWTKKNRDGSAGVWQLYPDRMLMRRARGQAQTDSFQDVLKGLPIAEDLQDVHGMDAPDAGIPSAPPAPQIAPPAQAAPAATTEPEGPAEGAEAPAKAQRAPRASRKAPEAQVREGHAPDTASQAATGSQTAPEAAHDAPSAPVAATEAPSAPQAPDDGFHGDAPSVTSQAMAGFQGEPESGSHLSGDPVDDDPAQAPNWDEVVQTFRADLLGCADEKSVEEAFEGVLGQHDAMPAQIEAQITAAYEDRLTAVRPAKANAAPSSDAPPPAKKKTFATTKALEKAMDNELARMRGATSTKMLQGIWDSHVVPFLAEWEISKGDQDGLVQVFEGRKKILARKESTQA